ncbi:hypothetical protein P7G51_09985 [Enterococcus asini]|uniref:hypothetical protein n=1 Tax=Enterococcus asini TaxID=57732 RepID=UPI002890AEFD|nr:hypothetical protein [Enterococcus asini]MDT2757708.1 hypothetical protein [Enterococcus asini]
MKDFSTNYPQLASWLTTQKQNKPDYKAQGLSHWFLLIGFGVMTVAPLSWHFALIAVLILTTALAKGPGMFVFGICYAALVSLFPPLAILLSAFCFFLSLWQLGRNWIFYAFAAIYFATPFALKFFGLNEVTTWSGAFSLLLSLVVCHFSLNHLYRFWDSRSLFWSLWAAPFDCLLFLLPKRFSKRLAPDVKEALSYGQNYHQNRLRQGKSRLFKNPFR